MYALKTILSLSGFLLLLLTASVALTAEAAGPVRRIGAIDIDIVDVYAKGELVGVHDILRYVRRGMNAVHSDTRHYIIRRELLFDVDDPVSEKLFRETERNLRALGFLSHVLVKETGVLEDGRVEVTVQVQETWSLMLQLSFSQSSGASRWNLQVSDTNFLGYGVKFIAGLGQDEDRHYTVFHFQNQKILGSPLRLGITHVNLSDGHNSQLSVEKPFYSQDTTWGFQWSNWDIFSESRFYLDAHDLGGVRSERPLYAKLPVERVGLRFAISRRVSPSGSGAIFRCGLGVVLSDYAAHVPAEALLSDGRLVDGSVLEMAENGALERDDALTLRPVIVFEALGRRWDAARNIMRMGPVEDLMLDPWLYLTMGPNLMDAGDDGGQFVVEGVLQDWSRIGRCHLLLNLDGNVAFGNPRYAHHSLELLGGVFLPAGERRTTRFFIEAARGENLLGSEAYVLGLFRGLRTLGYGGRVGDRLLRWNAEHGLRLPGELLGFYNVGVAVHYGGGLAWWSGDGTRLGDARHEAGFGLRFGPSRSAHAEVARLDLTWPLDGSSGPQLTATTSGWF